MAYFQFSPERIFAPTVRVKRKVTEERMDYGRLIRVRKYEGDPWVAYIVALADPDKAIELIRSHVAGPDDQVEDLGRVTDSLLMALKLGTGQYMSA